MRGLAALGVVTLHGTSWLRASLGARSPASFVLTLGTYGVELFFVLSGFCLAYPFLRASQSLDLRRFFARRLVRIVPPYWIAIALLAGALLSGASGFICPGYPIPSGWDVLKQALFLDRNTNFLSGTFWTLALELRWYLLFPLALWLWTVSPRAFFAAGAAAIVAFEGTTVAAADLYALPAFMLGIVAADIALRRAAGARTAGVAFVAALGLAVAIEWAAGPAKHGLPIGSLDVRAYLPPQRIVWEFVAFALVVFATASPALQRVLSWRPLAFAGTASYSIYLVHSPAVFAAHGPLGLFFASGSVADALAVSAVGIVAGLAFWRIVEFPITETPLKQSLLARVEPPLASAFRWLRLRPVIALTKQPPEAEKIGREGRHVNMSPLPISVIVPSLNQGHFIGETLDSILNQDGPEREVIVVDGGSTDGTLDVLRSYGSRIVWTSEPDRGQSEAINKGLRRARGEIVCYLNSDDLFEPGALALVAEYFARHEEVAWAFGRCRIIDASGVRTRSLVERYKTAWARYARGRGSLLVLNYVPQPATFWRASAMAQVGPIDESLHYAMDYDFWLRLCAIGVPGFIDRYLASFRLHDGSKTLTGARKQLAEACAIARAHGARFTLPLHRAHDWATLLTYNARYAQAIAPASQA